MDALGAHRLPSANSPVSKRPHAITSFIRPSSYSPIKANGRYKLRRYLWRSFLTFIGPLFVLGFYAYACFAFLAQPPINGVASEARADARWVFYLWFILAVLVLDWSRAGLANIEAAALMHPHLAPSTAMQLMWHTDSKWANPLWWLRAIRAFMFRVFRRRQSRDHGPASRPEFLWVFLSLTFLLLFISLPLSGLTMEFGDALVYTSTRADIFGPNSTNFNQRSVLNLPPGIRTNWQSGRATSPLNEAIVYAPHGTENVSSTYFSDQASIHANHIEFFTGPVVRQRVSGRAWGIHSNISCIPVPKDQLQMLQIDRFAYSINGCVVKWNQSGPRQCMPRWYTNTTALDTSTTSINMPFPLWLNETGTSDRATQYSFIAAADGTFNVQDENGSAYIRDSNHDNATFDHLVRKRAQEEVTTAMFEIFLWESHLYQDSVHDQLTKGDYPDPVEVLEAAFSPKFPVTLRKHAGIGIHCDVTTAVGYADLDPAHRTFSEFIRSKAKPADGVGSGIASFNLYPPQILALQAMAKEIDTGPLIESLRPYNQDCADCPSKQTWIALQTSINAVLVPPTNNPGGDVQEWRSYHSLTPKDLQHSMYKLLGESVISMMDEGGVNQYTADLYTLRPTRYLVPGIVSWKYVLALLSLWAFIMCAGALWMVFFAGRRWATSLDGFEMFKFGAQYHDDVNEFETVDLQGCSGALSRVPGMVGMLPGGGQVPERLGFIGLSENVAGTDVLYTLDRRQAARMRPF